MIVDWQHEPIKGALLHIDLKRIAMDKVMTVSRADPVGRRADRRQGPGRHSGACAARGRDRVPPGDIPSHLDVDVSNLEMNQADSRLRPAALRLDQVPHGRGPDRCPCLRDPRRGCRSRGSGCSRDAGRTRSCQEGQGRDRCRTGGRCQGRCQGRRRRARSREASEL